LMSERLESAVEVAGRDESNFRFRCYRTPRAVIGTAGLAGIQVMRLHPLG
jgi:hypothetical protein